MPYSALVSFALEENSLSPSKEQVARLSSYLSSLLLANEKMNLTALRDPLESAVKNLADCALCLPFLPQGAVLLDVGSGGGLPAFPFAILREDLTVLALDSTQKKVTFLEETAARLELKNLSAHCGRAEELAHDPTFRERFTAVSARAVARLPILAELCLPFLSPGSVFLAMKGKLAEEELAEAKKGIALLGGGEPQLHPLVLRGLPEPQERAAVTVKKLSHTPARYPRSFAKIKQKPL